MHALAQQLTIAERETYILITPFGDGRSSVGRIDVHRACLRQKATERPEDRVILTPASDLYVMSVFFWVSNRGRCKSGGGTCDGLRIWESGNLESKRWHM